MGRHGKHKGSRVIPTRGSTDNDNDVEGLPEGDEGYVKPKEVILTKIDQDIADIEDYEAFTSFHSVFCRCCFFFNLFGIILVMYGLGLTPLFESMAPHGGAMVIAIGAGACMFIPLSVWLGLKLCPMRKYAHHRKYISEQKQKRQDVTDKRLRYLYNKDQEDDEEEEVVVTDADIAINQQIKFAQINAAFDAKNRGILHV
jgi:hypothetical protein